jgi:hypothetical protein
MTLLAPAAEAGRSSVGVLEIPVNHRDSRFSAPSPEEGHRLLRSFFSIREPALRDAVVELATALALVENRQ